jgi:Protein of unknown function (DUF4239)
VDFIDSFSTTTQSIIVVLVFSGLTVAGLYFVRSRVSSQQLKEDHDVAGFTFSVVGAFYGVILAFVIVAVWQRFERANEKAQDESLALSNLYNLSGGFDQPTRDELQAALHTYATNVVDHEFKQMSENKYTLNMHDENVLWHLLLKYSPANSQQQTFLDKSVDQMAGLSDARRLRYVYYSEDLPGVIWVVIYVGCVITLGFSYFFSTRLFRSQAIMSATFAAIIGLTILAISELATPYQGAVVVSDEGFRFLVGSMNADHASATAAAFAKSNGSSHP